MIHITAWIEQFLEKLDNTFGSRVWFAGLQGSYARGEATDTSDIDMVVILDELSPLDIQAYHAMLDTLPHRELICGFLSGKNDILNWEPSDLFQFYFDTNPVKGSMDELLQLLDEAAVARAIKIGACNVYHGTVHNMLYDKSDDILKGLYKSASFTVQAICFQQTGKYIRQKKELLKYVSLDEQRIIETFIHLKNGGNVKFQEMSETLFRWAQKWIIESK